ncbi:tRNA (adenosine(37)-N6)-dimethylallyltransferase MiaA [Brackiella oedipodis]|uniref:tRNA (adenosine(37)-N6)-dimethylallyltransferase MiaA n=1 Tax=Brackiella oedipodis TaxID=124225 RepID=UPI00048E5C9F|nr:tRNA (adenosine(37)-N6)-dimethylallyltransferase MiaA [Brackiella oedipodis]
MSKIICLTGPTAAGKSAAVLAASQRYAIEIINVDSATIYKDMDIGTAKPSQAERQQSTQHLLDILEPEQSWSVADFCASTLQLIADIQDRGHIPLLAGGTMMYFKALREGLHDLPQADAKLRQQLSEEAEQHGWPHMHQRLQALDPITAQRLAPNDSQRIQRALEVSLLSGQAMSTLLAKTPPKQHAYEFVTISFEPSDRSQLHARIAQRFEQMIAAGFLQEVERLYQRPQLHADLPSIRCVGYRQLWQHLAGDYDLQTAIDKGIAATRQLAKRQITWLRSQDERIQIDCLQEKAPQQFVEQMQRILQL